MLNGCHVEEATNSDLCERTDEETRDKGSGFLGFTSIKDIYGA